MKTMIHQELDKTAVPRRGVVVVGGMAPGVVVNESTSVTVGSVRHPCSHGHL
jgi:hypothetical protein